MRESAARSEHHFLVGRPGAPELLLFRGPEGWALPCIECDEGRSADVSHIVRGAREGLGLEVSVLRCVRDVVGDGRRPRQHVHDLDVLGPVPVGLGGACPDCDSVILLADLLGLEVAAPS